MEAIHLLWALAAATGLVAGGLAGSGFALLAGAPPRPGMLHRLDHLTPIRVIALCLYGPLGLVRVGLGHLGQDPAVALPVLALGLGWSFLQGVFILTTFFGFS